MINFRSSRANRRPLRVILALLGALASLATVAWAIASATATTTAPTRLLPDLRADPPFQVSTRTDTVDNQTVQELAFGSMIDNIGRGPLIIDGNKASGDTATDDPMVASQAVELTNGTIRTNVVPNVGQIFFYYPHYHWHLLPFETYELHAAGSNTLVAPEHKAGYCLGDRYKVDVNHPLPGEPLRSPPWGDAWSCDRPTTKGPDDPDLRITTIREGISVGWGDDYVPVLEGQTIDITNVASGKYYLVNRVNMSDKLLESDYSNDAASALVQLTRSAPGALPSVKVLATCAYAARCEPTKRPLLVRRPRITGAVVGGVARCSTGTWKGHPIHFYYQWFRGGYPRPGATAPTYRTSAKEKWDHLTCQVTAANIYDSSSATSAQALVRPPRRHR
jgi:hypothetical protein